MSDIQEYRDLNNGSNVFIWSPPQCQFNLKDIWPTHKVVSIALPKKNLEGIHLVLSV